jgi:hypothetical protein
MGKVDLVCWKCGASLADVLTPFSRLSKCKSCKAELHVCRICKFYDSRVSNSCRETIAEKVSNKTRANFCGYFQATNNAYESADETTDLSKASLDALFGIDAGSSSFSNTDADKAKDELDALFGLDENNRGQK